MSDQDLAESKNDYQPEMEEYNPLMDDDSPGSPFSWRVWLKRLGMLFLGLLIFGSGALVGVFGTVSFIHQKMKEHLQAPEETPDKLIPIITRKLNLSEEQVAEIDPIIRKHHLILHQIREEITPKIAREFTLIEAEIGEKLNDEQNKKWHGWFDKMRGFWLPKSYGEDMKLKE